MISNLFFQASLGRYLREGNPGVLRACFARKRRSGSRQVAENGEFRHKVLKYAIIEGFRSNRLVFGEENVR
jgi:hypothetical protein